MYSVARSHTLLGVGVQPRKHERLMRRTSRFEINCPSHAVADTQRRSGRDTRGRLFQEFPTPESVLHFEASQFRKHSESVV